jgi:glycine/D-amino acid oxidase-like deaminating enzyme
VYWRVGLQAGEFADPLPLPEAVDFVIVGAGITGVSVALRLCELGASPLLLERGEPGDGASGLNAGAAVPCWPALTPGLVEQICGAERGRRFNRMLIEAPSALDAWAATYALAGVESRVGVTYVAHDVTSATRLRQSYEDWHQREAQVNWQEPDVLRGRYQSDALGAGITYRDCRMVNPLLLTRGLASAATLRGAQMHCHTEVRSIEADGSAWRLHTSRGVVRAGRVLVATDSFKNNLVPGLDALSFVLPYSVVVTKAEAAAPNQLTQPLCDTFAAQPLFVYRGSEGRLFGSLPSAIAAPASVSALGRKFERRLRRVLPNAVPVQWEYGWVGPVACSATTLPTLTRFGSGLHALGGYSGFGLLPGIQWGRAYAAAVLDPSGNQLAELESPPVRAPYGALKTLLLRIGMSATARFADRSYS